MVNPSGPITVVILVVNMDYISRLTIHSVCVHPFSYLLRVYITVTQFQYILIIFIAQRFATN